MTRVLVVGAGIAGAAAAWAAGAAGAEVRVVSHRVGASGLTSGALDFRDWQEPGAVDCALPECLLDFARELGTWQIPEHGALVISNNGVLRSARGYERGLLDLSTLRGREIGVPDVPRTDWDAIGFCKLLARDEQVQRLGVRFVPVRVPMLLETSEETCGSLDLAARHDATDRLEWLAEKLSRHGLDAWLFGPWLGTTSPRSQDLSRMLGVQVGETLSDVGEAAGVRTSASIEQLLARVGAVRERALLDRLVGPDATQAGWRARAGADEWRADAVVVACGGLASGGIVVRRVRRGDRGGAGLSLNFSTDLLLEYKGRLVDQASSLHGVDFEHQGRALLEGLGVGVRATSQAAPAEQPGPGQERLSAAGRPPGLAALAVAAMRAGGQQRGTSGVAGPATVFAAGDVRAGGPRTTLFAAFSGICAGAAASGADADFNA